MIRKALSIFLLLLVSIGYSQENNWNQDYTGFLQKYTEGDRLNYAEIALGPSELDSLKQGLDLLEAPSGLKQNEICYWLNAYNFMLIHQVVQKYPFKTLDEQPNLMSSSFPFGDEYISLKDIFEFRLRHFIEEDARLIFLLLDPSISGPPIQKEAYTPQNLNASLRIATDRMLSDSGRFHYQTDPYILKLSPIVRKYARYFLITEGSIHGFINAYKNLDIPNVEPVFYPYSQELNAVPAKGLKNQRLQVRKYKGARSYGLYNPGMLLPYGRWELSVFENLYTQTKAQFNGGRNDINRQSYLTESIRINYGASKAQRYNFGIDLLVKSTVHNSYSNASRFEVLSHSTSDSSRSSLTHLGAFVRFKPNKQQALSYQFGFYVPVTSDLPTNPFLDYQQFRIYSQIFYTYDKGNWQLYLQEDNTLGLDYQQDYQQGFNLDLSQTQILNYIKNNKFIPYIMLQEFERLGPISGFSFFAQGGAGIKVLPREHFQLELLYTNFFLARNNGLGETFNLGLRYLF